MVSFSFCPSTLVLKTVVIDIKTGRRLKAADLFSDLTGLARVVRSAQKQEIAKAIEAIKKDPETKEIDTTQLFESANFTAKDLNHFAVNDKGVTFIYDYGFPHVIQALQPEGRFTFDWQDIKAFIKPGGLLSQFTR